MGRKDNAHSDVETQYERSSSWATKLGTKVDESSRKRKHHSENRKHSDSEEDTSDSDTRDLSSGAWRSRSRSSEEDLSSHRSRRKRSHGSHDS